MYRTAKQAKCPHPPARVHVTIDPRYEMCQLCHTVRVAPLPAPWIVEWDESQPMPPAPPLFGTIAETRAPWRTIAERDATLLGITREERAARDDEPIPDGMARPCPRCMGARAIHNPRRRTCPRCQGHGEICGYDYIPGRKMFTTPSNADPPAA